MTAIMGRMSVHTAHARKCDRAMNVSKLDLSPPAYNLCDFPVAPVPVPGTTPLI